MRLRNEKKRGIPTIREKWISGKGEENEQTL
jgi:hypothetical protein